MWKNVGYMKINVCFKRMWYWLGSGHELLSVSTVFSVHEDSSVFFFGGDNWLCQNYWPTIKVNLVVLGQCMFHYIRAFSVHFHVSGMFFLSGVIWPPGFANIVPQTCSAGNFEEQHCIGLLFPRWDFGAGNSCLSVFTGLLLFLCVNGNNIIIGYSCMSDFKKSPRSSLICDKFQNSSLYYRLWDFSFQYVTGDWH